jgi:hypothetical protein
MKFGACCTLKNYVYAMERVMVSTHVLLKHMTTHISETQQQLKKKKKYCWGTLEDGLLVIRVDMGRRVALDRTAAWIEPPACS